MSSPHETAESLVKGVNKEYDAEEFIGEGYGYFDDLTSAITSALEQAQREGAQYQKDRILELLRSEAQGFHIISVNLDWLEKKLGEK